MAVTKRVETSTVMGEDKRIFAVGDIHGCHDKLTKLLEALDWRPEDGEELIFLGDYIDRGPNSYEVVETIVGLQEKWPNEVITLMGNHEQMFLSFISGESDLPINCNGLTNTVRGYVSRGGEFPVKHLLFYRNLKLYYETDSYIFVHAGLRDGVPTNQQTAEDLLWIRDEFLASDYDFGKTVVFGHTPLQEPFIKNNRLGIDTGAVYGGPLTAVVLPETKIISVE